VLSVGQQQAALSAQLCQSELAAASARVEAEAARSESVQLRQANTALTVELKKARGDLEEERRQRVLERQANREANEAQQAKQAADEVTHQQRERQMQEEAVMLQAKIKQLQQQLQQHQKQQQQQLQGVSDPHHTVALFSPFSPTSASSSDNLVSTQPLPVSFSPQAEQSHSNSFASPLSFPSSSAFASSSASFLHAQSSSSSTSSSTAMSVDKPITRTQPSSKPSSSSSAPSAADSAAISSDPHKVDKNDRQPKQPNMGVAATQSGAPIADEEFEIDGIDGFDFSADGRPGFWVQWKNYDEQVRHDSNHHSFFEHPIRSLF
jgi:hypothetical protein